MFEGGQLAERILMAKIVRKVVHRDHRRVRQFRLGEGLPKPEQIREELESMRDVLLGRVDAPINKGVLTLQEISDAYFGRACELEQLILAAQAEGKIPKSSPYHGLRTQEIRSFKELTKSAAELGSRRLTYESLRWEQEKTGRETGV